jgi:hypothetical protein
MGHARPARPTRGAGLLLALLVLVPAAACPAPRPATTLPTEPIDARFEPAFQSLAAALEAGDEPTAQLILDRILARDPPPSTRALAEAYGRILRGRALGRSLDLALEGELADGDQTVALTLVAAHPLQQELVLRSSTGTLSQILTAVDAAGTEQRVSRSLALEEVAELRLAPGEAARVALGRYAVPIGGALAVEAEWDLRLPPGTLSVDGEELPVQVLTVRGCETRRVAPWLPDSEVEPGELARYVEAGGRSMPALMERAVRIEPARRREALDALAPVALALPRIELAALVPALRWLSGERALGADAEAWAVWLEALQAGPQESAPTGPDLPGNAGAPRATVPAGGGAQR